MRVSRVQVRDADRVPFADEEAPVAVHAYDPRWPVEFARLESVLVEALGPLAVTVDHVGSTSVPGLAAKDCLDAQVLVRSVDDLEPAARALAAVGFRERPEPWNRDEEGGGRTWPKRVFAPARGGRPVNVHVRVAGSVPARRALLFRDHLRSNPSQREAWGRFKRELAEAVPDLARYGTVKIVAWAVLMEAAEGWAGSTGWSAPDPQTDR